MAFDTAAFRGSFPEFSDVSVYPDSMLAFWLTVAGLYVDAVKWGDAYTIGMSLALAHHLVLAANNNAGAPGGNTGLVSSQSAGDVSVGFDTSNTTEERGGQWNLTNYGQQYIRMARLIGGVAIQIND